MPKWQMFDKGHSDKLLSTDMSKDKDGALDTDVLIRRTPWMGGPPTEKDYDQLLYLANIAVIAGVKEIVYRPGRDCDLCPIRKQCERVNATRA